MGLGLSLALVLAAFQPAHAQAADIRFGIDPNANLAALKAASSPSNMPMPIDHNGNTYQLDGSAVLHDCDAAHASCDLDKLWVIAKDYNDYAKFGMPDLKQSIVVSGAPAQDSDGPVLFAWIDMVAFGIESASYLEVHTAPAEEGLSADSRGIYWVTATQTQSGWGYPNNPAFLDFHGSWYMQDLGGGDMYVRYYLSATAKNAIEGLVAGPRLQSDARQTVTILWQQAISASLQVPAQND